MTHEQCPFCKSKDRLSIRMPVHECWIQCRVCGARGPTAKNSDDAWTFWLWAWQEPEPASTTAVEVARGSWHAGGEAQPNNLPREQVNTELLKKMDHRLDIIEGHLAVMEKRTHRTSDHMAAIDRRLDDMQGQMDRIVAAVELPNPEDLIARAAQRVGEKRLYKAPRGLFSAEEKADPDNWLANHPRIRELQDEIDRLRKELYIQTGQTPGD